MRIQADKSSNPSTAAASAGLLPLSFLHTESSSIRRTAGHAVLFLLLLLGGFGSHALGQITVPNSGFESPSISGFQYTPSGGSWTFVGGAGISANGGGFSGSNGPAPEGTQVAFIQGQSTFSQAISGFIVGTSYKVTFSAAQRNYGQSPESWKLTANGSDVQTFSPPQSATAYTDYSATFVAASSDVTLGFQGLVNGDSSVLIDNVRIAPSTPPEFQFTSATASVAKGSASVVLTVARSNSSANSGTLQYMSADGSAFNGVNYLPVSGSIAWPTNDQSNKTITVPLLNPTAIAGPKIFTVTLSTPSGGAVVGSISTATVTITETPFNAWLYAGIGAAANNSVSGGTQGDADRDGISNLMEYALGGNLTASSRSILPVLGRETVSGVDYATLTYVRNTDLAGVTYHVESSLDLSAWSDRADVLVSTVGPLQTRKASVTLSGGPKFLHLSTTLDTAPPPPPPAPCWKTFMTTYVGETVWSDGNTYFLSRVNDTTRPLPPPGVTVTNIAHLKRIIDLWSSLGGTHISLPLNWEDTEPTEGVSDFRQFDWLFAYATSKGIKCNLYIWPLLHYGNPSGTRYDSTVSWKYEKQDVARDIAGDTVEHFMNFYSPRMANYYRWLHAVSAYLAPHWNAGEIGYVAVVVTKEKEMSYAIPNPSPGQTDFHPDTMAAYAQWHLARYGTAAPTPPNGISSSSSGQHFYRFKNDTLIDFVSASDAVLKEHAPIRCVWDVGSYTDALANRNVWGILAGEAGAYVDGYKHNPGLDYPAAFDTRAALAPNGWASIEWTNSGYTDLNARKSALINRTRISIDAGANDISFAFYDNADDPNMLGYLTDIVQNLKNSGHWTKDVPPPVTTGTQINVSVSTVLQNGSYSPYKAAFDSALSTSGLYPNFKITNDLP